MSLSEVGTNTFCHYLVSPKAYNEIILQIKTHVPRDRQPPITFIKYALYRYGQMNNIKSIIWILELRINSK